MHHRRWSERVDRAGFAVGWFLVAVGGPTGILLLLHTMEGRPLPLPIAMAAGVGAGILGIVPGGTVILAWIRWRDL